MTGYKRKLEDFDPNQSDPDDSDYDAAQASSRPRTQARSRKSNKGSPRKPSKRRRETYDDSDIEFDSDDPSEEEASFAESADDDEPVELNPKTGRGVRSAAKKSITYVESDEEEEEEEIPDSDDEREAPRPSGRRIRHNSNRTVRPAKADVKSLVVQLRLPPSRMGEDGKITRITRARTGSRSVKREPTPQASGALGARRSSRLSHDEQQPLVALTDSGNHEVVTRKGTVTPEPEGTRRPSRGGKGLKKPPSAIMEDSQEDDSFSQPASGQMPKTTAEGDVFFSHLEASALDEPEKQVSAASPGPDNQEDDIQMGYDDEEEEEEEQVVQDSQPEPEDVDEDDEPVIRGARSLRSRRKASTPPPSQPPAKGRRTLRNRKSGVEQSSDFEPDADAEADVEEEDISESDDLLKPPRGRSSAEGSSQGGRRSGRLTRKGTSNRSRSQRSPEDDELDPEEIADEAADLEEDNRRNRRGRKRPSPRAPEITFEPNLRNRGNRPDYRILRPELLLPTEDDDAPAFSTTTPSRNRRGGGATHQYRSLFSTFGPFGGAGGPAPVLGGPEGAGATGGVDSDSSDDERGGQQGGGVGGAVGMTPTSAAFPKPYVPQALNNDPIQGSGGGPSGLGKVRDKKALADADPLGVDPNVKFDGVGGLDNHINQLKEMVTLPLLYPEVFQRFSVTPPRGVLFHGPPGTGKTLLARALASSVSSHGQKVTFYMRKGADALSKWVGEAEKQLRLLFEEARKNQPSIIFFDEIDGLAPVRSSKQEQIHASIVATLLALMDGMDGRGQVIVIGATNRPDSVDPALRRPGRFDREFYFPLPDQVGRRKIIDIHTRGWDPPLQPQFKDQLAELTRGYGGADLRALCTEAALNAVQGTYPQIYSSDRKLIIDPSQIKVLAKDFMISVNKIVPSSERSAASGAAPLKKDVEPLLRQPLNEISNRIDEMIPRKRKITALEEAMYDERDDELGFEKENMQREFESARIFRPRLVIKGIEGMGQHYLGAALLSKFEGLHVQNFDLPTLLKDSTRTPEAAIVQLFEEVKRHKPSVIYIPNINLWYDTVGDSAKRTFLGLLRSLPPTDPVLLLGILELESIDAQPDAKMMRELFSYSLKNQYLLERPGQEARREFFGSIVNLVRKTPLEFPELERRKKRKLAELPVAPSPPPPPGPSKEELKAQKRKDRQTLNQLKLYIQKVMDQIKLKYKKFRTPPVEEAAFAYLYDEEDPRVLTTDLTEEERRKQYLFRPYEKERDAKGVEGIREIASNKFFYNLEIVTIEKRLSNGYYKRPKDFLADIKRLAKDAKTSGDPDRLLKANEMLANVEVDMGDLETNQPALCAECEAVYQREQERERELVEKLREAERRGEEVPTIIANVPPAQISKTTTEDSGPVVLGQEIPGRQLFPVTPSKTGENVSWSTTQTNGSNRSQHTNGSTVPSRPQEDSEMLDSQVETQGMAGENLQHSQHSQHSQLSQGHVGSQDPSQTQSDYPYAQTSAHTRLAPGSHVDQYRNSASTTSSGQRSSDRSSGNLSSNNTQSSNGVRPGDHPDFSMLVPGGGSQPLPDTQPPSLEAASQQGSNGSGSQGSQPRQQGQRASSMSIQSLVSNDNDNDRDSEDDDLNVRSKSVMLLDDLLVDSKHEDMVSHSSGLSVEQLEQVHAAMMDVIWKQRGNWNRNQVWAQVQKAFNDTVSDIEACQVILHPSQERQ